jgi:hypothetical protein
LKAPEKKYFHVQRPAAYHEHFCIKPQLQSNANPTLCAQSPNSAIWSAAALLPLFPNAQHDSTLIDAR